MVIPTFNDEATIGATLRSLESQSYDDFEVVVVDDGDDRTSDIVRRSPYRLIERDSTGIASALNRGIAEADGKYIARQDADDISHPDRLKRQVEFLRTHLDVGVLGTGAYLVEDGEVRSRRRVLERVERESFFDKNHIIHGSVMMRREAVEAVGGYDERLDYVEDLDLWVRLATDYVIANIDEPLYSFVLHDESIYAERLTEIILLHKFIEKRESGLPATVEQSVYAGDPKALLPYLPPKEVAQVRRTTAIEHLRYGRLREAKRELSTAILTHPSPLDAPLFTLTFTTPSTARAVADTYRRCLNLQIRLRNSIPT